MKDQVLKAFQALGFTLEDRGDSLYDFTYEEMSLLLFIDEEYKFISIHIPCVIELSEVEDELAFYKMMSELNSKKRLVKALCVDDSLWFSNERDMFNISNEDLPRTITRMIIGLESIMADFLDIYKDMNNGKDIFDTQEIDDDNNENGQCDDIIDINEE